MQVRKYWHEIILTLSVAAALAIIVAAAALFSSIQGLGVTAFGVFIAVLGVGSYDQWQHAELARARVKNRR